MLVDCWLLTVDCVVWLPGSTRSRRFGGCASNFPPQLRLLLAYIAVLARPRNQFNLKSQISNLKSIDCWLLTGGSKKWKWRELFVASLIRLDARLHKPGFDIIPAWGSELIWYIWKLRHRRKVYQRPSQLKTGTGILRVNFCSAPNFLSIENSFLSFWEKRSSQHKYRRKPRWDGRNPSK